MSAIGNLNWEAAKQRLAEMQAALDHSLTPSDADIESIYRKRAEFLSRIPHLTETENTDRILVFRTGGSRFAVPLGEVSEVITRPKISAVPGAPSTIAGLIQVRGEVRAIWNLAAALGLPADPLEANSPGHIILLRNSGREIGIRADHLEDIAAGAGERQPAPAATLPGSWLTTDFVTVLDVKALIEKLQDSQSL